MASHSDKLTQGIKLDDDKLPFDLLSPEWLEGVCGVSLYGAKKYEPHNWAKGINYSRIFSAAMRHMWAWWRGERDDSETGMHHLFHASCCLMYLCHYEVNKYRRFDDRPTKRRMRR